MSLLVSFSSLSIFYRIDLKSLSSRSNVFALSSQHFSYLVAHMKSAHSNSRISQFIYFSLHTEITVTPYVYDMF